MSQNNQTSDGVRCQSRAAVDSQPTPLSPTMRALVEYMRQHGNAIHRHPGGFWAHKTWSQWSTGGNWFGTSSVQALVKRGVAQYSDHQEGRGSRFPIAATLVEAA